MIKSLGIVLESSCCVFSSILSHISLHLYSNLAEQRNSIRGKWHAYPLKTFSGDKIWSVDSQRYSIKI